MSTCDYFDDYEGQCENIAAVFDSKTGKGYCQEHWGRAEEDTLSNKGHVA